MPESPSMTSSEIGVLWATYQQKTMILRMMEYFIEKADDEEAKKIMTDLSQEVSPYVSKITTLFQEEGIAVPVGFTSEDVNKDVPKLFDNGFDIMFIRLVKQISMGMHTLNLTMTYRSDITQLFRELTNTTQKYYDICTQYLLKKGLLPRSPYVTTAPSVQFVKDTNYLSGLNPFKEKRPLNTVEIGHLYHAIESNGIGMQMIFGFAQSATNRDIGKFFQKGGELAKSIVTDLSKIMVENDLQVPATHGGNITTSTIPPFSDKIMMYCISLFCSFSLGGNSLGTSFSLRNDLPPKLSLFMKDIFEYAHEGAKLMIKYEWMEEPPQTTIPNPK
ncbi:MULTISPECIES: DUF3231 family protein [Sutcliffiella]|uniref:DUF3231 family protein n=1 Tax=Sutcliffiella cohnii TaxID=33932 RepID=A0A223KWT7_9BACI|nr:MULTISPECIES: DUF3231 family protein [Sutcliffiella]AST93874.1 hypothetical protein BC6307_22650 [Sutcliffiella cohnii]WBL15067.1 DUF3231 family protein [Sutcliffiella sp. NC1]